MIPSSLLDLKKGRYERKFVVTNNSIHRILHDIKMHSLLFKEAHPKRIVNNIYFDSAELTNYDSHVQGSQYRFKLRLRWYGELFGRISPVLEIKIKHNDLSWKYHYKIDSFVFEKSIKSKDILKFVVNSKIPSWLKEMIKSYHPVLLNRYSRYYFISFNKKYRLTLDYDMEFYNFNKNGNNEFLKKYRENSIIIECKFSPENFLGSGDVGLGLPFRMSASSKYLKGIDEVYF